MLSYYIYYRIEERHGAELETRIRNMQADLRTRTGIPGRLLKKRGDPLVWMEVYEDVSDSAALERTLAELVEKYGINECLTPGSARMTECFSCDA